MKILMLNPPFFPRFSRAQRSPAVIKSGTLYYPIWLGYATGVLEARGHDVRLIDAPARGYSLESVVDSVAEFKPDLMVLDSSTPSFNSDVQVAGALKAVAPRAPVVFVGNHVSATAEQSLKTSPVIDVIARGEYDFTLAELAEAVAAGDGLAKIAGISYREGDTVKHTGRREYIWDLDQIPWVSKVWKKHLNASDYFYSITRYPEVTIVTSRGCPYRCSFCVYPQVMHGHKYRRRSAQDVADEFAYIEREFPEVKEVFIEDDTFTIDPKWVLEFCERKVASGCRLPWTANSRVDLKRHVLEAMRKADCRLLCVGFESGNQEMLDRMHKGVNLVEAKSFVRDAQTSGIMVHGCFMCGNVGETRQTFEQTVQLALDLNPDTAQFFPVMVYPGTETYEHYRSKGFIKSDDYSDWVTAEGWHNCVVSTPELSPEEMVRLCDDARDRFYLRKEYVWSKIKQVVRHPHEFPRVSIAAKNYFLKYMAKRWNSRRAPVQV
jgi:radical SAM superfamily enzyme YgiQ (UPF0313 family)